MEGPAGRALRKAHAKGDDVADLQGATQAWAGGQRLPLLEAGAMPHLSTHSTNGSSRQKLTRMTSQKVAEASTSSLTPMLEGS